VSLVVRSRVVPREEADRALEPRDGLVLERPAGEATFEAAEGPVHDYVREVRVEDVGGGRVRVDETIRYRLAFPFFRWLFAIPFRLGLARDARSAWWAPPQRVDARGATALATLCVASVLGGYLASLLSHTIAFAGREFDVSATAQGVAGIAARVGGVVALVLTAAAADRWGRRRVILWAAGLAIASTLTTAGTPSLPWFTASQAIARSIAVALLVCIAIAAAEEMPKGSRAYAVALLGLSTALGSGIGIMALPLADLGVGGWRLLYVIPVIAAPVVWRMAVHLPETRRFSAPHARATFAGHHGRFWLLAVSGMLASLFVAPATFFLNRFLLDERGFSATGVSVFTILTSTPAVIGVVIGGRLADTRGRKPVGASTLFVATIIVVLAFNSSGAALWVWALVGSVIGAAGAPALGVYGPELFPTSLRGKVGGLLSVAALVGSAVGLIIGGIAADTPGGLSSALIPLAAGPLIVAVLVLLLYPETAGRELEDLNPEDRQQAQHPGSERRPS
jgi:MFS family permease